MFQKMTEDSVEHVFKKRCVGCFLKFQFVTDFWKYNHNLHVLILRRRENIYKSFEDSFR